MALAQHVLERNRRGAWTCPSSDLYPHQWLWDSCFNAIGIAHYDPPRAAAELRALFRGQWANGMLPHMIFAPGGNDVGSRTVWQSHKNPLAPRGVHTSCITQPPLAAIAVWRVGQALTVAERAAFFAELFPKLVAYHTWLYTERDLDDSGLVTLIHPWECGLDTTPPWMRELRRMPVPRWLRVAMRFRLARLLRRLRYDTRHLPASERTSDDDGVRMLVLAIRAKEHNFVLRQMPPENSVLIEDLAFNSFLAVANRALERIARDLGRPVGPDMVAHLDRTDAALERLWDEPSGQYYSRNAASGGLIKLPTVATFIPLWADVPDGAQTTRLLELLRAPAAFWPPHPVPSVPLDAPRFREARYWMGPTWVNMNWVIIEGLRQRGEGELAAELRQRTLALVADDGFFEYFSPLTGAGYGAPDFSWTAALVIDLLARES